MKKFKKFQSKRTSVLNSSVTTYGKNKVRIISDSSWLEIHDHKKGLFSDSDDGFSDQENIRTANRSSKGRNCRFPWLETQNLKKKKTIFSDSDNDSNIHSDSDWRFELPKKNVNCNAARKKTLIKPSRQKPNHRCKSEKQKKPKEIGRKPKTNNKPSHVELANNIHNDGSRILSEPIIISSDSSTDCVLLPKASLKYNGSSTKIDGSGKSDAVDQSHRNQVKRSIKSSCDKDASYEMLINKYKKIVKPSYVDLSRDEIPAKAYSEYISCHSGLLYSSKKSHANYDLSIGSSPKCPSEKSEDQLQLKNPLPRVARTVSSSDSQHGSNAEATRPGPQPSLVVLHSSKKKYVTSCRRRRRGNFKITNGTTTFSFSEHFLPRANESIDAFQQSIVHGNHDCHFESLFLHSFDRQQMANSDKPLAFIQSTPLTRRSAKIPFVLTLTPLQNNLVNSNSQSMFPLSSTPSLNSISRPDGLVNASENSFTSNQKLSTANSIEDSSSPQLVKRAANLSLPVDKVLRHCNQVATRPFECLEYDRDACRKLGEGVYGEVYSCRAQATTQSSVAVKVLPVNGEDKVNGEKQKTFSEVLPEIVSSIELSHLSSGTCHRTSAFISLCGIHCISGQYPDYLLRAWDDYLKRNGSENDRPDFFPCCQDYIVFEFVDGGSDMEHFQFRNAAQALSLIRQTVAGLAVAERMFQYEHRDLHWGNVLVEANGLKSVEFTIDGVTKKIETIGITARIIDFTFSRMTKGGLSLYQDLSSDPELFTGDANFDYQFNIYRMMKEETNNDWSLYRPKTNVFWIHYLVYKFLHEVKFKFTKSKIHATALRKMKLFNKTLLDHSSCVDIVQSSALFSR